MSNERDIQLQNIEAVLKTRQGRDLVWEIFGLCDMYSASYEMGEQATFRMGRRSVGIDLLNLLDEIDPAIYPRMMLENIEKE